ncbi:MAG: GSU2403 family nucleotidyltransferase fold protein [Candidatus Margulisiibacteriota bacterium]
MIGIVHKILRVFQENGLWDEGVELIGSWCFLLYQKHFGVKAYPFRTVDIDFLIPSPYKAKNKIDIAALLAPLGFKTGFNSDGSIYMWGTDLKVEFLTPERGRGEVGAKEVRNLSIKAIPLRFVDILFKNPVWVKEQSIDVLVPNMVCFGLHKLLIAARRKNTDKKRKDLEHAILALTASDKRLIIDYYEELPKPWKKAIIAALEWSKAHLVMREKEAQEIILTLQTTGK